MRVAAAAAFLAISPASGQQDEAPDYPNRPVKIIVSVPAGGGVDTVTRIFAAGLQQRFGQPFVIENRGGGGGNIVDTTVYAVRRLSCPRRSPPRSPAMSRSTKTQLIRPRSIGRRVSKLPNVLLVRQIFQRDGAGIHRVCKADPGKVTFASQGRARRRTRLRNC
jgi:tripartite-type tricarboxylate transporter receptor subunit TctC